MSSTARLLFVGVFLFILAIISVQADVAIKHTPLPQNVQPLTTVSILLDTNHVQSKKTDPHTINPLASFTSIHTLSTDTLSTFSAVPLSTLPKEDAFPFGKFMQFSFKAQNAVSTTTLGVESEESSDELREFTLSVDEYIVDAKSKTPSTIDLQYLDEKNVYSKHTSFKGTRVNKLGQEEEMYLTLTPNTGDFMTNSASVDGGQSKKDIETQQSPTSNMRQLSMDSLSGRADSQYTIEGVFIAGNGDMYQILSYSSVQFQVMTIHTELATTQLQLQNLTEQSLFDVQAIEALSFRMNTLSTMLDTMAEQRFDAAYDLSISKIDMNSMSGTCGTHGDNAAHTHDSSNTEQDSEVDDVELDEPISSLDMIPNVLSRWSTECNPYIGRTTRFSIVFYAAYTYRLWSSDSTTTINTAKSEARTKLFLQLLNRVYQQQLNVVFKIQSYVNGGFGSPDADWNTQQAQTGEDDTTTAAQGCIFSNSLALNSLQSARTASSVKGSVTLGLSTCLSVGVVGLAYLDTLCKVSGVAVNSMNGIFSWTTLAHEVFHIFGSPHPFGTDSSQYEQYSGLMNYNYIRLDKKYESNDRYQFAFNEDTDSAGCDGIQRVTQFTDSTCYEFATTSDDIVSDSCGNGSVEPWEECDMGADSSCCKDCKLTAGSTCASEDTTCCPDCTAAAEVRCFLPGQTDAKRGQCNRGTCTPLLCDEVNDWAGIDCADSNFFFRPSTCFYGCPSAGCGSISYSSRTSYEEGSYCTTTEGYKGLCVLSLNNDAEVDFSYMSCVAMSSVVYTWKYTVIRQCTCSVLDVPEDDLLDVYTCYDQSNFPVEESFCENSEKPTADTCCCSLPCSQDDEGTDTSGGSTDGSTDTSDDNDNDDDDDDASGGSTDGSTDTSDDNDNDDDDDDEDPNAATIATLSIVYMAFICFLF